MSCNQNKNFESKNDNIIFTYQDYIKYDFRLKKINVDYYGNKFTDSIKISKKEEKLIINSFNENNIGSINGEFYYLDIHSSIPGANDKIEFKTKLKTNSNFIINSNYEIEDLFFKNQEYKVVKFRNEIKNVLCKNQDFKRVLKRYDSLLKKNRKGYFLL